MASDRDIRILVVEDDFSIRNLLVINLEQEGYHITSTESGKEAVSLMGDRRFDLVVLDVMLPDMDGFAVCQSVRIKGVEVPILFLTARNAAVDRIEGLKLGGDDYLTKPFELEELLLRIALLLKRHSPVASAGASEESFTFGKNQVFFKSYEIIDVTGERKRINKREMEFLRYLILNQGQVVRRADILEQVWGYDVFPNTRTIDNYILALRKHFEENPRQPQHIHSVRGVGYKFTP